MNEFALSLLLLGALSSGNQLPFWMSSNQFGLMPESSGALALFQAGTQYDASKDFQWKWGVSLAGNYERFPVKPGMTTTGSGMTTVGSGMTEGLVGNPDGRTADFNLMVDELYASAKWKMIRLDAGMKRFDLDFYGAGTPTLGSMSTTGGHICWSGNARTMPGYLITVEPFPISKRKIVWLHGAFGDFKTIDNRYVKGALVHRTNAFIMFRMSPRLDFHFGLDHIATWAGTSPVYGEMPVTFDNYYRMLLGKHAGEDGTASDRRNTIGDQLGSLVFRFDWRGDDWKVALQHDAPYADRSGMRSQNIPDGVNTIWFGFDNKDRWVTDVVYEYQYSMWQSGTRHDRPATPEESARANPNDPWKQARHVQGGGDNYFNNGEYKSGWTYYGRTIGNPLFVPKGTHAGTWTGRETVLGVENNRLKAHHISVAGKLFRKMPYKLMLTYSQNYGTYKQPYIAPSQWGKPWGAVEETPLHQVSGAFMGEIPLKHFAVTYGIYADRGQLLPDVFGATLGLRYSFQMK